MELDEKDLLQANATIIAGILILLSFSSFGTNLNNAIVKPFVQTPDAAANRSIGVRVMIAIAIIPFIIAAYVLLEEKRKSLMNAKFAMKLGLAYLGVAVLILLLSGPA